MPSNQLPTSYQEFIHLSRYSRWLPDKNRRETWDETVGRYFDFFTEHLKELHNFNLTVCDATSSNPTISESLILPQVGPFNFIGDTE